ncbi:MAG: formate--tetrahydrofolate ligase [Oscillospiraceae bacterium]|jgi:formate--tetrahydrofolate ligase|nr:formate--tetrahydrofolate ligase [Oscillospiraceae bacterium]
MKDIEIAQSARLAPIEEIARAVGLAEDEWESYGRYKAKVSKKPGAPRGALVLVTAVSPTPMGEGKTTVSVGLADGLRRLGKNTMLCLREPSLGPVFGIKGGAAGGGYAQVVPMEDLNLHFTGDIHAVTAANNLLAAAVDNHLQQGNTLGIDPRRITWKRCMDMNDRALRGLAIGLGGAANGVPREDGFDITAASEIMAVLCLSEDLSDLRARLARLVVGSRADGKRVTCGDLGVHGAMAALLRDAMKPNLVQTLEHTPTFIHGGPFANIAHGCSSLAATRLALSLSDIVVTEAGFGADLGAEKFIDIKCRAGGLKPSACVIVATARSVAYNGGTDNLRAHIENMTRKFGLPAVVAINRFAADTPEQLNEIARVCEEAGARHALCEVWAKGGEGGEALAAEVLNAVGNGDNKLRFLYPDDMPLKTKIETLAREIYGADGTEFAPAAAKELDALTADGYGNLPVCVAKTQYSLSDDPKKLGRPAGFTLRVSRVKLSAGAGFVVVYTGEIMTMPGLPRVPAYESVDVDANGLISGLF